MLPIPLLAAGATTATSLLSVAWVALEVGALSYGGGFVIIPLMQADAVNHYHRMTGKQLLNAVALGQVTPGPVVQTVAVVGYAAADIGGGLLASAVAFTPSFAFILLGAEHFDRLRTDRRIRALLNPQRGRSRRHRRDPRLGHPAAQGTDPDLAICRPRRRGLAPAGRAPRCGPPPTGGSHGRRRPRRRRALGVKREVGMAPGGWRALHRAA